MKNTLVSLCISALACFFACVASGCGAVTFTPDYNEPALHRPDLKRANLSLVRVADGRAHPSNHIGMARVGLFNQAVPYILDGNVAEVIRTMFDTLMIEHHDTGNTIPVTVSIKSLLVGESAELLHEEAFFAGNFEFSYPSGRDSIITKSVSSKQKTSSSIDVTNSIKDVFYAGIADCASKFVNTMLDKNPGMTVAKESTSAFVAQVSHHAAAPPESIHTFRKTTHVDLSEGLAEEDRPRVSRNEIGFEYFQGKDVTSGVRASYALFKQSKDTNFVWGLVADASFMGISNKESRTEGIIVDFGGGGAIKKYLTSTPVSPFVTAGVELLAGTEHMNTSFGEDSHLFFGGLFDEAIGISINRSLSVKIGSFQVLVGGSNLLTTDVGILGGFSIGM